MQFKTYSENGTVVTKLTFEELTIALKGIQLILQNAPSKIFIGVLNAPLNHTFSRKLKTCQHYQGLFQKIRACVQFNQKRARTSSKRAKLWIFTPHSSKFRAFGTLHPPKRHVFLEFLEENKANHSSKRALRAATARNKWLKKALTMSGPRQCFQDPVKHLTAGLHYEKFL